MAAIVDAPWILSDASREFRVARANTTNGPGPFTLGLKLEWHRSSIRQMQTILAFRKKFFCARSRKVGGYRTGRFLYRVNSTHFQPNEEG